MLETDRYIQTDILTNIVAAAYMIPFCHFVGREHLTLKVNW